MSPGIYFEMLVNYLIILYLLSPARSMGVAILEQAGNPLGAGALGQKGFCVKEGEVLYQDKGAALLGRGKRRVVGRSEGVRAEKHQSLIRSPLPCTFSCDSRFD